MTLYLLLPYHPAERRVETPAGFDGLFYPPGLETAPKQLAIVRANRYMVDNSDCLIAYLRHPGSTQNLVEYAQRRARRGKMRVTVV